MEPIIRINGVRLSEYESMLVRTSISDSIANGAISINEGQNILELLTKFQPAAGCPK